MRADCSRQRGEIFMATHRRSTNRNPAAEGGSSGARSSGHAADKTSSTTPLAQVRFKSQPRGSRLSRLTHDLVAADRVRKNLPTDNPRRKPSLASGYRPPQRLLAKTNLKCDDTYFLHVRCDGTEVRLKSEPKELFRETHFVTVVCVEPDGHLVEEVEKNGALPPHGRGWSFHHRGLDTGWQQRWRRRRQP